MNRTTKYSIVLGEILLITLAILAVVVVIMPSKASAQYNDGYDDGYDHFGVRSQNPIPFVYSISPSYANVGDNVTTITVTGNGFTPNSVARWNGSNRQTTFIDRQHLMIHLTAGDLQGSSGRHINVYNPNRNAYSNSALFSIRGYVPQNNGSTQGNNGNNFPSSNNGNTTGYNNGNNGSNGGGYNNYNNSLFSYTNTGDTTRNTNGSYYSNENQNRVNGNEENISSLASGAIFGSNSLAPSGIIQWVLFAIAILLIVIIVRKFFGGADRYHNSPLKHA